MSILGFNLIRERVRQAPVALNQSLRPGLLNRPDPTPHTPSPGGSGSAAPGGSSSGTGTGGSSSGTGGSGSAPDAGNTRQNIMQLNGDGDSAYMRLAVTGEAAGNVRAARVGAESEASGEITVTQNGEGDDATYTVRYDKSTGTLATVAAGTDTVGKGAAKNADKGVDANARADAGLASADVVEMTYSSKEDAARAAELLQELHAKTALGPNQVNPLATPLVSNSASGEAGRTLLGISNEDMSFLQDNITAYETSLSMTRGLEGEVGAEAGEIFNLALEGRLEGDQTITRRVELPTEDQDGTLSYTLSGGASATGKQNVGEAFDAAMLEAGLSQPVDVGQSDFEISVNYTLPAGTDISGSGSGRPVPEYDAVNGDGLELQSVSLKNTTEAFAPLPEGNADGNRQDSVRLTSEMTINNPENLRAAVGQFLDGQITEAANTAGVQGSVSLDTVNRSGGVTNPSLELDFGLGNVGVEFTYENGTDDVTNRFLRTFGTEGASDPDPENPTPPTPNDPSLPPPEDDGKTLVVTPWNGTSMRTAPGGDQSAVIQNGTFLRTDGETATDANGAQWVHVTGTDVNDQPVEGWVASENVAPHSSATGAMDEIGRTNPTLEYQRYDAVTVQEGDNLWDMAQEYGVDPQELIALNSEHLQNPSLIFPGDTIYIPGTARGPETQPTEPPTVEPPGTEGPGSGSGSPTSGSGSGSGTGSESEIPGLPTQPPAPQEPTEQPTAPTDADARRTELDRILSEYQVNSDELVTIDPLFMDAQELTMSEAALLGKLSVPNLLALRTFMEIRDKAPEVANDYFPVVDDQGNTVPGGNDGHNDAFRHAYWNALMTREHGEEFAKDYATAHERRPDNEADREAMDLYNNEVGRRIAVENPDASDEELAQLIYEAVQSGEMVVIDGNGELAFSDQVEYGQTGTADDPVGQDPDPSSSSSES